MLKLTKLDKDIAPIKKYINLAGGIFCDLSIGIRYMWRNEYRIEYAILNDTLIMKECGHDYDDAFYYPIGSDLEGAFSAIEEYVLANNIPLHFCCVDNVQAGELANRYKDVEIINERDWSDYIYKAEQFKTYAGKKLSGQRNHVNKFKRLYPDYKFKVIEEQDLPNVKQFLKEFEESSVFSDWSAEAEERTVVDYIDNMFNLAQVGGFLSVDGKIVAISVGEAVGENLIVHVEKALKKYDGVYPTMAQEFARAFANDNIKFINREEDCGDTGLRISKLQYRPIEVREKNNVKVKTLFDKIKSPIFIKTERLSIQDFTELDKNDYARLYLDQEINKWWGYDYREDLKDGEPTPEYFYSFQKKLKAVKEEYALAVKEAGKLVGELVLHSFDFNGGVEIGFRFFKEHQGKGFALESALALKEYCFEFLGADAVKSRCFKENLPSKKLIEKLGLKKFKESETHYFFAQKNKKQ